MGVRLLPVVLVRLGGRFCLGRVPAHGEFFLLGSSLCFRMVMGLGFVVGSLAVMPVAGCPVLMRAGAVFVRFFLLTSIRGASCSHKSHYG
jgi:hypothetical protein